MTEVIQTQIDSVRAEQERIVRQKHDENFSADAEKARLDEIGERVMSLVSELSEAAYGRRLDRVTQGA
jgi:division protein CdvB (Snf7/Vps24/ESCRT-III family)